MAGKANKNNKNKAIRNIPRIDGQGDYYTDRIVPILRQLVPDGTFQKTGGHAGKMGGTALGAKFGSAGLGGAVGSRLGRYLGSGVSRLVGFGDYSVQNNSLFKEGMAIAPGEAVPAFGVMGHETRVKHREYIGDILTPTVPAAFTNLSYTINAGDTSTFPWLASIAANYQQYKINGLIFEFKSLSSELATGGALGSVIMATNYSVVDDAYPDKLHMENAQFTVSAKPSCSQIHSVECDPSQTAGRLLYVRDSGTSTSASQDPRLFDMGRFQIATAGLPGTAGTVLGELWASYDISLYKPELDDANALSSKIVGVAPGITTIFGTSPTITGSGTSATVNTITFSRTGQFLVLVTILGTNCQTPTVSGTVTAAVLDAGTVGGTAQLIQYRVTVSSSGQTLIFDASASTTITASRARISGYVYSLA